MAIRMETDGVRGQGIDPGGFLRQSFTHFRTWIGETGGVEGCPADCGYCFFKLDGKTPKRPQILIPPEEAIGGIAQIETYHPDIPIHFGSQTDIFANKQTIEYYRQVVERYGQSEYTNPLIFITKRRIPENFIDLVKSIPQKTIFYVSYSGLNGTGLEPGVNEDAQRGNFVRLSEAGMPAVHYWRPFFPQNSTDEVIRRVLDHTSKYALCSVAVGLHLNDGILKHVAPYWPELLAQNYDFSKTGEFWPDGVLNKLQKIAAERYPNYPVYLTNTPCSISYALGVPDVQGSRFDRMCERSNCPSEQRALCESLPAYPLADDIEFGLNKMGIDPGKARLEKDELVIDDEVATARLVYLRFLLRFPVRSNGTSYDGGHNWASATKADQDIIEVPWVSR